MISERYLDQACFLRLFSSKKLLAETWLVSRIVSRSLYYFHALWNNKFMGAFTSKRNVFHPRDENIFAHIYHSSWDNFILEQKLFCLFKHSSILFAFFIFWWYCGINSKNVIRRENMYSADFCTFNCELRININTDSHEYFLF